MIKFKKKKTENRLGDKEGKSNLEYRIMKITQSDQQKNFFTVNSLKVVCCNIKYTNICMVGVPKGEEERVKNIFNEIMTENFPKWKKETDFQVRKSKRVPNKINSKKAHHN